MHILILGGGGREHALAWKIAQSPRVSRLSAAPGSDAMASLAACISIDILDGNAVTDWARREGVGLVVIGPEAPLEAGVSDTLRAANIPVFGPSREAAALETSKTFTKQVCDACAVPTAAWARFDEPAGARAHIEATGAPIVVKADGLAAGKGVVVASTVEEACSAVDAMFAGSLGTAGASVVVEEFMPGEEASLFVLTDGSSVLALASAQDHKRAYDGDEGPNTGGMGAYSPAPVMTPEVEQRVMDEIIRPTISEMARRGTPYSGVLYAGLMIADGEPRLVEYNARFGDPECQALMLRLKSDLVPALLATAAGELATISLDWHDQPALTVVMATKGYPGAYQKGSLIRGIGAAEAVEGVTVFHAGTRAGPSGLEAHGGRVLNVSATGEDLAMARARAYSAVDQIDWPAGFVRRDIGWRALG